MDTKKRIKTVRNKIDEVLEAEWAPLTEEERCKLETIQKFCNELLYYGDVAAERGLILNHVINNKAPQLNLHL